MSSTLIKGATVITMDTQGVMPSADIPVTNDSITDIAPHIEAKDAEHIDATGCIVIPGLINAHLHTWQTVLRGVLADWCHNDRAAQHNNAAVAGLLEQGLRAAFFTAHPNPTPNPARHRSGKFRTRVLSLFGC